MVVSETVDVTSGSRPNVVVAMRVLLGKYEQARTYEDSNGHSTYIVSSINTVEVRMGFYRLSDLCS